MKPPQCYLAVRDSAAGQPKGAAKTRHAPAQRLGAVAGVCLPAQSMFASFGRHTFSADHGPMAAGRCQNSMFANAPHNIDGSALVPVGANLPPAGVSDPRFARPPTGLSCCQIAHGDIAFFLAAKETPSGS